MARIKGGMNAKKKHNRVLKLAKGYRGARSKQYRIAKQSVISRPLISKRKPRTIPCNKNGTKIGLSPSRINKSPGSRCNEALARMSSCTNC